MSTIPPGSQFFDCSGPIENVVEEAVQAKFDALLEQTRNDPQWSGWRVFVATYIEMHGLVTTE